MKLVVGIVRPERLDAVKQALAAEQVFRLTVSDVQGVRPASGGSAAARYAGGGTSPTAERMVKLEVAVNEDFVEPTLRALSAARRDGGGEGDGCVFVLPLDEALRIRTGERGPDAI
ncbi:MAG: P-II family nitrogen regulator [Planctomycetota bacterium]